MSSISMINKVLYLCLTYMAAILHSVVKDSIQRCLTFMVCTGWQIQTTFHCGYAFRSKTLKTVLFSLNQINETMEIKKSNLFDNYYYYLRTKTIFFPK